MQIKAQKIYTHEESVPSPVEQKKKAIFVKLWLQGLSSRVEAWQETGARVLCGIDPVLMLYALVSAGTSAFTSRHTIRSRANCLYFV